MYCIESDSLKLSLEVVPVSSLLPHEEILPHAVNKLMLEFKGRVELKNPIIVDENGIVLDGNHRAIAFKELKFKYISVCRINYFSQAVKLKYWFRVFENCSDMRRIEHILKEMNVEIAPVTDQKALKEKIKTDDFSWGIQHGSFFAILRFDEKIVRDAVSAYAQIKKFQQKLAQEAHPLKYIPCGQVLECNFDDELKENAIIIWTPRITKEMVVKAAKKGKVFAPKTTRHLIPARPLNVDVPVDWFRENISLEKINHRFRLFLEDKGLKRFGPGQIINGRYYGEELFVFYQIKKRDH